MGKGAQNTSNHCKNLITSESAINTSIKYNEKLTIKTE